MRCGVTKLLGTRTPNGVPGCPKSHELMSSAQTGKPVARGLTVWDEAGKKETQRVVKIKSKLNNEKVENGGKYKKGKRKKTNLKSTKHHETKKEEVVFLPFFKFSGSSNEKAGESRAGARRPCKFRAGTGFKSNWNITRRLGSFK